jgi:pyrroline-5-carboxylate reductase
MKICVIGSGKMGDIIVGGMIESGFAQTKDIIATDHSSDRRKMMEQKHGVSTTLDNALAVGQADVILFCVKPQNASQLADDISQILKPHQLLISIMAGVTLEKLESWFAEIPVIRAMPNTPSQVNAGMTAITAGSYCNDSHLACADRLFSGIGRTIVLDEKHVDAVTGLSASGPAFIYIAIEALADGGVKCGLPRDVAIALASQMTLGAAKMVIETGKHPALLKDEVTTPAGCTTNGILALEEGGLRVTLIKAVTEATKRASELG